LPESFLEPSDKILDGLPKRLLQYSVDPYRWRVCESPGCGHPQNATIKWAFQTKSWYEANLVPVFLRTIFRQTDPVWIEHLTRIAKGQVDSDTLAFLVSLTRELPERPDGIKPTQLYTRRARVNEENAHALAQLPGLDFVFHAVDSMSILTNTHQAKLMGPSRIIPKHLQNMEYKSNGPSPSLQPLGM
jgi:hypothetical protein